MNNNLDWMKLLNFRGTTTLTRNILHVLHVSCAERTDILQTDVLFAQ